MFVMFNLVAWINTNFSVKTITGRYSWQLNKLYVFPWLWNILYLNITHNINTRTRPTPGKTQTTFLDRGSWLGGGNADQRPHGAGLCQGQVWDHVSVQVNTSPVITYMVNCWFQISRHYLLVIRKDFIQNLT